MIILYFSIFESFPKYLTIFFVYVSYCRIPFFASLMVYQNGTSDPPGIKIWEVPSAFTLIQLSQFSILLKAFKSKNKNFETLKWDHSPFKYELNFNLNFKLFPNYNIRLLLNRFVIACLKYVHRGPSRSIHHHVKKKFLKIHYPTNFRNYLYQFPKYK